jgi:hypothetical protein
VALTGTETALVSTLMASVLALYGFAQVVYSWTRPHIVEEALLSQTDLARSMARWKGVYIMMIASSGTTFATIWFGVFILVTDSFRDGPLFVVMFLSSVIMLFGVFQGPIVRDLQAALHAVPEEPATKE